MRVFLIGSGGSLKGFDFTRLDNEETIGCNSVLLHYPAVKNILFLDKIFFDLHKKELEAFKGNIYAHVRTIPKGYNLTNLNIFTTKLGVRCNTPGFLSGYLSGLSALNLAVQKGYDEIYLLGYDMYPGHFYEMLPGEEYKDGYLDKYIQYFSQYAEENVFNCSNHSKIRVFPFANIDDVLGDKDEAV